MLGILVGAVGGGLAVYYWRGKISDYISHRAPHLRAQAADALGSLGDRACGALDRARSGVDAAVRTGQERLRPAERPAQAQRDPGQQGLDSRDVSQGRIMLP
jgi:hypothetical protein